MTHTGSPHDPPLSETDIQAYADGLLAPERAARLRNYLGNRPGEARRVAFYGRLNAQIQRHFRSTDEPLPAQTSGKRLARTVPGQWYALRLPAVALHPLRAVLALAVACAVALVAASGWTAALQVSPQALNNAAVMALAQAAGGRFGAATSAPRGRSGAVSGSATASPLADDSAVALGPGAPDLTAIGMRVVARRTLKLGPLARATEFVYLNAENQPVVLLTASAWAASAQPQWSARRVGALRLLTWTAHRQRYVLAGAADARGLMRAADAMTMR